MVFKKIVTALDSSNNAIPLEIYQMQKKVQLAISDLLATNPHRQKRRTVVNLLGKANMGLARLEYMGVSYQYIAFSLLDTDANWGLLHPVTTETLSGWHLCTKSRQQKFDTLLLGKCGFLGIHDVDDIFDRIIDTESKILETVATSLDVIGYNGEEGGFLYLYTDRKPCCSCSGVIQSFEKRYPSVAVHTLYGGERS